MQITYREALWGTGFCIVVCGTFSSAHAQSKQPELIEPFVCSAFGSARSALSDKCEITPFTRPGDPPDKKRTQVKVLLEAQSKTIVVGGYRVTTENYGTYVPPVVEAAPGDTVAAHLTNSLQKPVLPPHGEHGDPEENPTNLHYFHGGIVTPNNSRPMDARLGNGDNIYVYRKRGETFDFSVPIPGKGELDARVLEVEGGGTIAHPSGLNWYHSHLHGISSTQVMGGLSGLLSVGDALANVKAACQEDEAGDCANPVDEDTRYLKEHTDPKYVLLRDIPLKDVSANPRSADGTGTATWAPDERDSLSNDPCGIRDGGGSIDSSHPSRHEGYCQRADRQNSENRVWLFTLNGQRFPKITIRRDRNSLLRMGNLSANMAYWLELGCEEGCDQLPQDDHTIKRLEVLSLDGVVPAKVIGPVDSDKPKTNTFLVENLLLMPASRVEFYVRNDFRHERTISLILRTKKLKTSTHEAQGDVWPEIQLARIILEPSVIESRVAVALNAPVAARVPAALAAPVIGLPEALPPPGCVRDLKPETNLAKREHRRVSFGGTLSGWNIGTEIVHFPERVEAENEVACDPNDPSKGKCVRETLFEPDMSASIGVYADPNDSHHPEDNPIEGVPFEVYVSGEGIIDWFAEREQAWNGKPLNHVCIFVNPDPSLPNIRSHKQLWVLTNSTNQLHNFHIHQMKFRLAKRSELIQYRIEPPKRSSTCDRDPCDTPNYKLYEDDSVQNKVKADVEWHDTIPVPGSRSVFIIMSFDAKEQLGRFVYHCHILKHEDHGLMAPIEVLRASQNVTE